MSADTPPPATHPLLTVAVAAAGTSIAILAGRGASPGWMIARVLVVAAATFAATLVLRRSGPRRAGATVAALGTVTLAIGLGFLPHLVKGGLSVTSSAAVAAVVAGIAMLIGGSVLALRAAAEASGDTRFLLIAAGQVRDEQDAAAHVAAGAPDRVEVWVVPGAEHTDGLATAPAEWERRVVDFLESNLS